MQLLNIIQCTNLGGMEQASLLMMKALMLQGHGCHLLSLNPIGPLGPALRAAGIPFVGLQYRGRGGWRSFPKLRSALRAEKADALIMTGHNLGAMLALDDLCSGSRLLAMHFHHAGVMPNWQWRLIYCLACSRFQAITFPSDFVRDEAITIYPPVAQISHTVRNAVAVPLSISIEDRILAREKLGLPPRAKVVGNAGWLIPRKRYDVFLRVAAVVAARIPESVFVIAGDGPERESLEDLAGSLGIADRVRWLGWQTDLTPFHTALDAFLFNSDWDAMGLTAIEAMGHSTPVIASVLHGGLREILDRTCGFLIDRHDIELLAENLICVLEDPQLAVALGNAGRSRVMEFNSIEVHSNVIAKLLGIPTLTNQ